METNNPQTLVEAVRYFADPAVALAFAVNLRWPDGVSCPTCGRRDVSFLANQNRWQCRSAHPKRQFSVKTGTIFEDSPIPLDKWLIAIWMIANNKNGISSYEVARGLDVTQKTAWFMMHRIRLAMQSRNFSKLVGEVEVDETFIGGKARNMHPGKRKAKGRGAAGKAVVMGVLERHGEVRATVVDNTKRRTLLPEVKKHVETGATVYTDALKSYAALSPEFVHMVIDHAECYVKGAIHTNGMENFWSLLKRGIHGTYVAVEPFHLFRYVDEQSFRFNNRKGTDSSRFLKVLANIEGKRLKYETLIGETAGLSPASVNAEASENQAAIDPK